MPSDDTAPAVRSVRARIGRAAERAGRDPAGVRLMAVTKTVDVGRVDAVLDAGVHDLGENRVQEAVDKRPRVRGPARWHLIGHLQTNKVRRAAAAFDSIQTVDSARLARQLAGARAGEAEAFPVLIEVELTGLAGRTGVGPAELEELARRVAALPELRLQGLMTVAAPAADPEQVRPHFMELRLLRDRLEQTLQLALPDLSMGMSDDFEVAVEEGATVVRVGRAIFGDRPPVG